MSTLAVWLTRVRIARGEDARLPLVLLLAGLAGLHLFTLVRVPPPFVDEAWFTSHAWGLIKTGHPFGPLDAGVSELYEGYWTYFSYLGSALLAIPILAVGMSVMSVRLVSLVFGLILLVAIYRIASCLYDRRTGLFAVGAVGLSQAFMFSAHLARPDILVAAAGFGAIALVLSDRDSGVPWRSALGGMVLGLSFEMHPNAMLFGPVVMALLLVDHGWSIWRRRRAWAFVGGTAAGLAVFIGLHVLPYPQTLLALTRLHFASTKNPPLLDPSHWGSSLVDTALLAGALGLFSTLLALAAVVWLAMRRSPADIKVLVIVGLLVVEFVAIIPYKPPYYGIYLMPAIDLLLAVWVAHVWRSKWHGSPRALVTAGLTWGLTIASLLSTLSLARNEPMNGFERSVAQIREIVPPGSVLMGEPRYWFGLSDHPYFAWQALTYYRSHAPSSTLDEAFRWHRPDFFILDSMMAPHIVEDPTTLGPWAYQLHLPKRDLDRFLAERGHLVAVIDTQAGRTIELYQITWD